MNEQPGQITTEAIQAAQREAELAARRGPAFDAAWNDYEQATSAAFEDYVEAARTLWDRYQTQVRGIVAEHEARVERIRSGDIPPPSATITVTTDPKWLADAKRELGGED